MDSIPPDVAKKLLNRDFANLVKSGQVGGAGGFVDFYGLLHA